MRVGTFLTAVAMLLFPLSAFASTPTLDTLCKGYTGDPSDRGVTFDQSGDPSIMDTFLKRKALCPSACFDVTLTLSIESKKLKIVTTAVNKCKTPQPDQPKIKSVFTPLDKPNDNRNCNKDQGLPSITATTKKLDPNVSGVPSLFSGMVPQVFTKPLTVGPKSRCDSKATSVIASFTSNGDKGLDVGLNKLSELSAPTQAEPVPDAPGGDPKPNGGDSLPGSPTTVAPFDYDKNVAKPAEVPKDSEGLAQMLQEKYGVPADQAKTLAENNTDDVKSMIEKSMTNDTAGAQEIAKRLNLNEDTMKSIAEMTPPKQITPEEAQQIADQQQQQTNTFQQNPQTATGLPTQCGTEGLAGNIMRAESSCGQINSNPLSSVQGPYHFLCGTWQAYANSTGNGQYSDCNNRNDPAISTMVMNAKMDQFAAKYGSSCTQAGLSLTSCQYAIHVFGEGGYRQMFNSYLSNPNDSAFSLCGSALSNAACTNNSSIFRNGGSVAGVFGELDRRLGGNGTVIPNVYNNPSPFTGFTGNGGSYVNGGSPFAGASFFNSGSLTGYSIPTGYSTNGYGSTSGGSGNSLTSIFSGIISRLFGQSTTPTPVQSQTQVQYPTQQVQGVASIIAQPTSTYKGGNILVSWSSVGVRTDQQCRTEMVTVSGTTTIAVTNEGSRVITATTSGMARLTITCNAYSGAQITQSTTVSVQ